MKILRGTTFIIYISAWLSLLVPESTNATEPVLFSGDRQRLRYADGPNGWVEASEDLRAEIEGCQSYQCFSARVAEHVGRYRGAQTQSQPFFAQLAAPLQQGIGNCTNANNRLADESLIDCQFRILDSEMSPAAQNLRRLMIQMKDESVGAMALGYSCNHSAQAPSGACPTNRLGCCPDFFQVLAAPENARSTQNTIPQQTNTARHRRPPYAHRSQRQAPPQHGQCHPGQPLDCTSPLMGSFGHRRLDSSGVPRRCWERYRCQVRNQDTASEVPMAIALGQMAESRYQDLQAEYLKQMFRQWAVTEASQVRGGCDGAAYDRFVNHARRKLRGCHFGRAQEAFQTDVTSDGARRRFHDACLSASGVGGVDHNHRIQNQARKLLRSKCNLKYLTDAPAQTFEAALALDVSVAADANDGNGRRGTSNVTRFQNFIRSFNEECGANADALARNAIQKARSVTNQNLQTSFENIVSCSEQTSEPGLDTRPLSELLALATESADPNQWRSYDARRASTGVTNALIDTYSAISNGIAGVCSNDLQHNYRLNLGELESTVGSKVPFHENFSLELLNLSGCSLETRDEGGGRGFFPALARGCDIVMAEVSLPGAAVGPAPEAALAGFCVLSSGANHVAQQDNANALMRLRRSLGVQMDCESASELSQRLATAQGEVDESRVSTLMQLGMLPGQIALLLSARQANTAREAMAILDGEISAQRRVRSFLSARSHSTTTIADLEQTFPELFLTEAGRVDARDTLEAVRSIELTPDQIERFYQRLADEASLERAGIRPAGCIVQ